MDAKLLKPYLLVNVNRRATAGYDFAGEVMSFPIPHADGEATVMVRRVPGHPGTLEEMRVSELGTFERAEVPKYVHYAEVEGFGQFPVDMLRYDRAAPVNFTLVPKHFDSYLVAQLDPTFGHDKLIVATATRTRHDRWTGARWSSFLWRVTPLRTEQIGGAV